MSVPTRATVFGTAAGVAAATVVVALVDPNEGGHYPLCPLRALTGLYCPFCGGLRAVHDLAHLNITGALDRNPLAVIGLPIVALLWLGWAQQAFTGRKVYEAKPWWGWATIVLLAVFMVARNLPGGSWLSPA